MVLEQIRADAWYAGVEDPYSFRVWRQSGLGHLLSAADIRVTFATLPGPRVLVATFQTIYLA
jgi:hypothetical protein